MRYFNKNFISQRRKGAETAEPLFENYSLLLKNSCNTKDYEGLGLRYQTKTPCLRASVRALLLPLLAVLCTSCVSQYKVVVEFSSALKDHFTEIPTIEVDIAAVTDSEADEVKQMGVEKYFDPGSGIRDRLRSQTCFFYREEQNTYVLPSRAPVWQEWKLKEPANVLVIASLPHDPSITSQTDPRYLAIKMSPSFVVARTVYILVEPKKIIQVTGAASKKGASPSADSGGQWVEIR